MNLCGLIFPGSASYIGGMDVSFSSGPWHWRQSAFFIGAAAPAGAAATAKASAASAAAARVFIVFILKSHRKSPSPGLGEGVFRTSNRERREPELRLHFRSVLTSPATRENGARHAVADIKTTSRFTGRIESGNDVPKNVDNLTVLIDPETAREVVHEEHDLDCMERTLLNLLLKQSSRLLEVVILLLIDKAVVAGHCRLEVLGADFLSKFIQRGRIKRESFSHCG